MFLEWVDNSLYQQRLFVFCVVLFSINTDIYIDFVIDIAYCIVILVMWLYHDVFICLDPSSQLTTTTTTAMFAVQHFWSECIIYGKISWTRSASDFDKFFMSLFISDIGRLFATSSWFPYNTEV